MFFEAYLRNGGIQYRGQPEGPAHWYIGGGAPADSTDFFFQEFFGGVMLVLGKQKDADRVYAVSQSFIRSWWKHYGDTLGLPTSDIVVIEEDESAFKTGGFYNTFTGGAITFQWPQRFQGLALSEPGEIVLSGEVYEKWVESGLAKGPLGFPISGTNQVGSPGNEMNSLMQAFEGGAVYRHSTGPLKGQVFAVYEASAPTSIAFGKKVSSEFRTKVVEICRRLNVNPDYLMAAMFFETGGTFSPTTANPASGAMGLIQFLPSTATSLGTTVKTLRQMTAVEQLDYVEKYFTPYTGKLPTLEDVYMAILWPKAIGQPSDYVLFATPGIEYSQNRGLDLNGDGKVTRSEASDKVRLALTQGLDPQNRG